MATRKTDKKGPPLYVIFAANGSMLEANPSRSGAAFDRKIFERRHPGLRPMKIQKYVPQ